MSSTSSSSTAWSDVAIDPVDSRPSRPPRPYELLDDGFAPDPCELLVIGCGNILRGDDAVGPILIRHLYTRGVPDGVRLVDGGTSGMDVAFGMRGAARVVLVDAASTGATPGTLYRVPAHELEQLPPIDGLHTHNFRWDHALSFSTWLLGPLRPTDITVFLIEAGQLETGAPLSDPVGAAMETVIDLLVREFYPTATIPGGSDPVSAPPGMTVAVTVEATVEITSSGYLHLPADLAAERFPADVCVARIDAGDLVLMPLVGVGHGGLVLKQLNAAGDRSLLVSEVFSFAPVVGTFVVSWDKDRGALRVQLSEPKGAVADGHGGPDGGGAGERTVGGLPAGPHAGGGGPAPVEVLLHAAAGAPGGGRDSADGRATTSTAGGAR